MVDKLEAGLKISEGDIKITDANGNEIDSEKYVLILNPEDGDGSSSTDIEIKFNGEINETYKVNYNTTITDFTKDSFYNGASLKGTGIGEGVTVDPVEVPVPNNSYNKNKGSINHTDKTMTWTITVNPTREAINELTITDTFPNNGLILLENTLKVNLQGEGDLERNTDYTLVANSGGYQEGFEIKLIGNKLPINNKLTITYKTSYDTQAYTSIINNTGNVYKNKADFTGKTINGHDIISNDEDSQSLVEASWNTGKKEVKLKSVNSQGELEDGWISGNERKIQWEVYINYQEHNIGKDITVSDTLDYDGKVDIANIKVREYNVKANGDTEIIGDPIGASGKYSVTSVEDDKGFELKFNSEVTKRYVVIFTTSVPKISKESYTNTAYVSGDEFDKVPYSTSVGFTPYDNNVSKESIGVKNDKVYTDDEIQWKVKINEALSVIEKDVTITDTISDGLVFNKSSLKIYKLGKTESDKTLVNEGQGNDEYTKTFDDKVLTIKFNESIDSAYEIKYTTIVTAVNGEINNEVSYGGTNLETKTIPQIKYTAEQFSYVGGDPAKGRIEITKKDNEDSTLLLSGVEFEVWYELNGEDIQFIDKDQPTFVTDANGKLIIGNLPLRREYTIKEVEAPKGYVKKNNPIATIYVENSGKSDGRDNYLLEIKNDKIKGNIEFKKINEKGIPLKGVEFTLYKNGTELTIAESDSNGKVSFTDVEYGEYTIKETSTLEGYILYDKILNVSIGDEDDGEIITPTVNGNEINQVENIVKKGNIEFKKVDENDDALEGAKFKIFKQDSGNNSGTAVTDENGDDVVAESDNNGIVKFTDIPYGDYIITEFLAPDGYVPSDREIKVSIKENGETVKPIENTPIENIKIIGDIQVRKLDEDGETGLSGAVFVLEQGGVTKYTSDKTDEFGNYIFKNVKYGTYTLKEKTAPEGYNLSDLTEEVIIKQQGQELIIKRFVNTKMRGDIKLKKVGENEEGLAGAVFSIYKSTDTEFKIPIDTATSNSDGEVLFEGIAYGEYEIKETIAPAGYNLSNKVLDATITTEGETVDLTNDPISNTKIRGNVEILKRNRNTHRPLRNAIIALYEENETYIDEKISGDDGKVVFENLVFGRYYFQETKAPAGYIRDNNKYYFDIEHNGLTLERNLDNRRRYYPPVDPEDPDPEDPTDPEDPEPEEPVDPEDPDPEEPTDPEDPDPTDPTDPEDPEEPTDPEDPEPTEPTDPEDPEEDDPLIDIDGDTPTGGTDVEKPGLPKTGEVNNLVFYLGGLLLIALGIFLRKKAIKE